MAAGLHRCDDVETSTFNGYVSYDAFGQARDLTDAIAFARTLLAAFSGPDISSSSRFPGRSLHFGLSDRTRG